MWPLAYWVDLQIYGYQPMPLTRMLVWVLPLVFVAIWMYALNNRILGFYVQQQKAEDRAAQAAARDSGSENQPLPLLQE